MDDALLVRQTLAGNRDAFRFLVLRHQRGIFRFLGLFGVPPAQAEELAQETFLRAYRSLSTFDPELGAFSTWLYTIARSQASHAAARRHVRMELAVPEVPEQADHAPDPLAQAQTSERRSRLMAALAALPEAWRSALVLFQVEGLSIEQVAAAQGCAAGTVKSRIFRAREKLRAVLEEETP